MTLDEFEKMLNEYRSHLLAEDKATTGYYWIVHNIVKKNIVFVQPEADQAFLTLKYSEYLNDAR